MTIDLLSLKQRTSHFPVLIREILANLDLSLDQVYLDCTFGAGGYTSFILESEKSKVIAIDRDQLVMPFVEKIKEQYGNRFDFYLSKFSEYDQILDKNKIKVDAIIMDLGFSSMQIENNTRGFSFQREGNLSMEMGFNNISASEFINQSSEKLLADVIYYYGEEHFAKRIARNIVNMRKKTPIVTTFDLADIVKKSVPFNKKLKIHPATRTFQAIRIYVNQELDELNIALNNSLNYLNENGKLFVVSFHSLEDKIVKDFFKNHAFNNKNQKYFSDNKKLIIEEFTFYKPKNDIRGNMYLQIITKKPIIAKNDELEINPPSSSAKLRIAKLVKGK